MAATAGDPSTPPADGCCLLFELPPELRLQIYEYLLVLHKLCLRSFDEPSVVGRTASELAKTLLFYEPGAGVGQDLYPAVLRTSKTVCGEAEHLLFRPSILHLSLSADRRDKDECKGQAFDMANLSQLRRLSKMRVILHASMGTVMEDVVHSHTVMGSLPKRMELGELELRIPAWDIEQADEEPSDAFNITVAQMQAWIRWAQGAPITVIRGAVFDGDSDVVYRYIRDGTEEIYLSNYALRITSFDDVISSDDFRAIRKAIGGHGDAGGIKFIEERWQPWE